MKYQYLKRRSQPLDLLQYLRDSEEELTLEKISDVMGWHEEKANTNLRMLINYGFVDSKPIKQNAIGRPKSVYFYAG